MTDSSWSVRKDVLQPLLRKLGVCGERGRAPAGLDLAECIFNFLVQKQAKLDKPGEPCADEFVMFCARHASESHAQLFQDLFVRWCLGDKRDGFFVEFGASNGIDFSNTKLLEEKFDWRGILAEPARCWHDELRQNRSGFIDTRCVWRHTGETLSFNEAAVASLSTINSFSNKDKHAANRQEGITYDVETISIGDLLSAYDAPFFIDYLSIDTEGSELAILESLDFDKYTIGIISVEHNHGSDREGIYDLLVKNGFTRTFTRFSKWDDWYLHESLAHRLIE